MTERLSKLIEEAAAKMLAEGAAVEAAIMTPRMARQIAKELDILRERPEDELISEINTPFGSIEILTSPYCPPEYVYYGTREQLYRMARNAAYGMGGGDDDGHEGKE